MIISSNNNRTSKKTKKKEDFQKKSQNNIKDNILETEKVDFIKNWQINEETDINLRPTKLVDYIGQSNIVSQLKVILTSAKLRQTLPENLLFYGQPGLGKTTIASLIAGEMESNFKVVAAPTLQRVGDLVSLLLNLESNTILFIDEIHRLKAPLEETLYIALEDKQVDLVMGKGHGAKSARLDLPKVSFVGATTQLGKIAKPLKDRFTSIFHMVSYTEEEILQLINRNIALLGLNLDQDSKKMVANYCRGVPRIANHLLKRLLDYQIVHKLEIIKFEMTKNFFTDFGLTDFGLTRSDIKYLSCLKNDQILGVKTLASMLMEEVETLEEVLEPYLLYLGFINKTSKGRELTSKGKKFLKENTLI